MRSGKNDIVGMSYNYEKGECIGKGSFGEVYKAVEKATSRVVALKLQDLEKAEEEIEIIQREIQVMSQISSPHVVKYFTSFIEGSTLWIVMEYMAGGSLKELLDAVGPFPEDAIALVMKALCKGLEYIHRERKLHRDIKASNILLSGDGGVKLADFGVAGQMTNTLRQTNTFVGSPFWMAPEVIEESLYNEKADIWSVGITAMELANGIPPYAHEHPYKALLLIPMNEPPRLEGQFSKSFKDFVALCLRRNPSERQDAINLLHHPFLKKARASAVRDLLSRKGSNKDTPNSETVYIGGDSITEIQDTINATAPASKEEKTNDNPSRNWEFDFGSLGDNDKDAPNHAGTKRDLAASPPAEESNMTVVDSSSADEQPSRRSVPESEILSELFLPVLSKTRADVAEEGTSNGALLTALGALEVALVDVEGAKPGACETVLRSLLAEAAKSSSAIVRTIVTQTVGNGKADAHNKPGRHGRR